MVWIKEEKLVEIHKKQFKPLPCHRILNVLEALKSIPSEYRVYAIYGECAYPVTDVKVITPECGVINIFFERTCRKVPSKACTTIQLSNKIKQLMKPVSYTHLDVYKRQILCLYQDCVGSGSYYPLHVYHAAFINICTFSSSHGLFWRNRKSR